MKKLILGLTLLATVGIAFGATLKETVIAKIISIKAAEFITPEFITKVIESREANFGTTSCNFHEAYYMCRVRTYDRSFGGENANDGVSSIVAWENYLQFRTVVVARMKEELHSGNTLAAVYINCREAFLKIVARQGPQFQGNLHTMLKEAVTAFEAVKHDVRRKSMIKTITRDERERYGDGVTGEIEVMLAKNRPAAEIAQKISKPVPVIEEKEVIEVHNLDIAKFALRRWNEGGATLVNKYLAVLRMAEKDVAGVIEK